MEGKFKRTDDARTIGIAAANHATEDGTGVTPRSMMPHDAAGSATVRSACAAGNDTVIDDTDRAVGINAVETADGAAGFVGDRTLRQQDVLGRLQNLESQKVTVLASTMWWARPPAAG